MRVRPQLAAVVAFAALVLVAPPAARADGDPASDVLIEQPVFYGSALDLTSRAAAQLDALVRESRRRGYLISVVVISRIEDLGSVGYLYGDPDNYADFLAGEIRCCVKGRVLIVMPDGLGVSYIGHSSRDDRAVVDALPAPNDVTSLLPAAIDGVVALAGASHVRLAVPDATPAPNGVDQPITHASAPRTAAGRDPATGGGGLLFLLPVAALLVLAVAAVGRRRMVAARSADADAEGGPIPRG